MKKYSMFKKIWKRICFLLKDTRGEIVFHVDGHEIIATFTEKYNDELMPRLREILLGYPHIRHDSPSDSTIEKNIKEAV